MFSEEKNAVTETRIACDVLRPILLWYSQDEANRNGGKWILRLKKGLAARYWEDLVRALTQRDVPHMCTGV